MKDGQQKKTEGKEEGNSVKEELKRRRGQRRE